MDQKFTLTVFGAWMGWVLGLGVAVADVFAPWDLLGLTVAVLVGGLCLTVRCVVRSAVARLSVAFNMGREAERRSPGVRGI